jgi:hypothetical protein
MREKLGVNVSEVKKMSPAEKQLEGLYNGLIKLVETWTNTSQQESIFLGLKPVRPVWLSMHVSGLSIVGSRDICSCLVGTYMKIGPKTLKTMVNDRPLVRLLLIINKDGSDGYPTRKLLKRLGSNELHPLLARAEKEGYIKRERRKPEGKGNHLVCNYLTKKGKALVDLARKIQ